jgi:hypothetical protein
MNSPQISALKASKTTTAAGRDSVGGLLKLSTNRPPFLPVDVNVQYNGMLPKGLGIFMLTLNY